MAQRLADTIRDHLLASANEDGGWGYYAGKKSRLEPTAWAVMGLAASGDREDAVVQRAAWRLARWQRSDGFLNCTAGAPPNIAFNGLAALALNLADTRHAPFAAPVRDRLLDAITRTKGSDLPLLQRWVQWLAPSRRTVQQDDGLKGWPWVEGTFSWVEPTAWCTLALKKCRPSGGCGGRQRVTEAERLLLDRCCAGGGWNYGNAKVLGTSLPAYVPTSAVALLALQDCRHAPEVIRSVGFLFRHRATERSGPAMGLATLALDVLGEPADDARAWFEREAVTGGLMGNNAARGLALCVLDGDHRAHSAFVL